MKKVKTILLIMAIIGLWFSKDLFWYYNFKAFYDLKINDVVIDERQGRGGKQFKTLKQADFFSIYSEDEKSLKIGDSISKKSQSDEIKIYKKSNENVNWNYYKSIYIKENLDFYSLIIKENQK